MIRSNKAVNKITSTLRKSRQLSDNSFYVGSGSVSIGGAKWAKTAYAPGQSPGMKSYLDQWGPMPKENSSRGVKRVDKKGILDLYNE